MKFVFIPAFGGGDGTDPTPVFAMFNEFGIRFVEGITSFMEANQYVMKLIRKRHELRLKKIEKSQKSKQAASKKKATKKMIKKTKKAVQAEKKGRVLQKSEFVWSFDISIYVPMAHQIKASHQAYIKDFLEKKAQNKKRKESKKKKDPEIDLYLSDHIVPVSFVSF